jgi:hypothetical protein
MYGYPLSMPLMAALSLFCAVHFHGQLRSWLMASESVRATKMLVVSQAVFLAVNLVVLLSLVDVAGSLAGGLALLFAGVASLVALIVVDRRVQRSDA